MLNYEHQDNFKFAKIKSIHKRIIPALIAVKKKDADPKNILEIICSSTNHYKAASDQGAHFLTVDGKRLISGELAFELHQTHGFPLSITIEQSFAMGFAIDWHDFVLTALMHKWKHYQVWDLFRKQVEDSLIDPVHKMELKKLMMLLIKKISPELFD